MGKNDYNPYELVGEFVSIFRRGDRWYANFQHRDRQVRKSLRTKNKKEARRRALLLEKEIIAGEYHHQKRAPDLAEVIQEYLDSLRSGRSQKTIDKYQHGFDLLLELAKRRNIRRIDQVDLRLVDAFRTERSVDSKPKTVHNDTVAIKQPVNFALKRRLISEDPLRDLKLEKPKRTPQPCWSREEIDQILEKARPPYQQLFLLLADTGMRVGEAKWLTWDDIHLVRGLIHIRPKEGWRPKTGDERVVPMSPRVKAMLKSLPNDGRWVFTARQTERHPEPGRQISERRSLAHLKRVLKRLGLRGHQHTFRHSFISFAAYKGTSERVLRRWIGHVDPHILEWYFHLADQQSIDAMDCLMQSETGSSADAENDSKSAQSQHNKENDDESDRAK